MLSEAITFYNINRRKILCFLFNAFMYLFILEGEKVVRKQQHVIIKYAMKVVPYCMGGH